VTFLQVPHNAGTSRSPDPHDFTGPFVTSVGGTTSAKPEIAVTLSGGGFSTHFTRPAYQANVVNDYVEQLINNNN
jgi:hypothetical protein